MPKETRNIEIEYRSRFDKKEHDRLKRFLDVHAKDLGKDDKDVYFFLFPDKLLKTVNNVSRGTAKIVLKLNKIGKGSDFEEIEIPINQKDFDKAAKLFLSLKTGEWMRSFQKRRNYLYKGVELALKWSNVWGYHLELERVINDTADRGKAAEKIRAVAKELGVRIMTDKELKEFTKRTEREYKKTKIKIEK